MLRSLHQNSNDSASVFTAETWEIIKSLEEIKNVSSSKYIIFTDSLSCVQSLQHMKLKHPLIGMVIRECVFLTFANDIILCWVPNHVGNRGNENADSAAKSVLDLLCAKVGLPQHQINSIFFPLGIVANKLHSVKPVL